MVMSLSQLAYSRASVKNALISNSLRKYAVWSSLTFSSQIQCGVALDGTNPAGACGLLGAFGFSSATPGDTIPKVNKETTIKRSTGLLLPRNTLDAHERHSAGRESSASRRCGEYTGRAASMHSGIDTAFSSRSGTAFAKIIRT